MSINSNLSFSTAHLGLGHMKQHPPPLDIEVFPSQLSHNLSSISPSVFFLCSHYKKKVPEALYCFLFFIFKSCFFLYGWPISYKMLCISTFVPKSFKLLIGPYFFFPQRIKDSVFFPAVCTKLTFFSCMSHLSLFFTQIVPGFSIWMSQTDHFMSAICCDKHYVY